VKYELGSKGKEVKHLQQVLMILGYPLPKFGPDGELGNETMRVLEAAALDLGTDVDEEGLHTQAEITATVESVLGKFKEINDQSGTVHMRCLYEQTMRHRRGPRSWSDIDAIVLHQTACQMKPLARYWAGVPAHVGIPHGMLVPTVYLLSPLNQLLWHANSFNRRSVGIEVSGNHAGVISPSGVRFGNDADELKTDSPNSVHSGLLKVEKWYSERTCWKPGRGPDRLDKNMIEGGRAAIAHIIETVEANGGHIKYVFAHRQSSKNRVADPGQEIWTELGRWAMEEHGLSDGGDKFVSGKGYPLPDVWTGEKRGVTYFPWGDRKLQKPTDKHTLRDLGRESEYAEADWKRKQL